MYPITPATSASHYLSDVFEKVGGIVHQAEDEIAACAFAIGASYAGKCTVTITSGPGYSLKQEGIGLAVMGEIPLVVVNVQRGGPSTGQPTKVEQGDLLHRHVRQPRRRAESGDGAIDHRGMLPLRHHRAQDRRDLRHGGGGAVGRLAGHLAAADPPPALRSATGWRRRWTRASVPAGARPYDWDAVTGLARRFIPGQPGGMHTLTGLGARHRQPRRLRPRQQRAGHPRPQPEAGGAAKDAAAACGSRRCRRRPAGGRLGQHPRRHRGGGGYAARRGPARLVGAPDLPAAHAARAEADHAALPPGDDHRGQLERPARRRDDRRRTTAATPRSPCCCAHAR